MSLDLGRQQYSSSEIYVYGLDLGRLHCRWRPTMQRKVAAFDSSQSAYREFKTMTQTDEDGKYWAKVTQGKSDVIGPLLFRGHNSPPDSYAVVAQLQACL
ncbi:hypothetical protein AJ80_02650 [Polytolypa hystricis UAMH7299]|uniref:Uncharacterized protein n=1 Tax=Polytolypa hystricis (strain UAMH7299) TaxID=1447883 RepID=A0A2B7YGM5_POLH7|nr:hypothetical protein AJ80_02650 [Polytolypa hystricis UAMH7299]